MVNYVCNLVVLPPQGGKSPTNTNVFYLSSLQMKSDWTVEKKMLEQLLSDLKGQLREKEEKLNLVTAQKVCRFFLFVTFFLYFFLSFSPPPNLLLARSLFKCNFKMWVIDTATDVYLHT